MDKIATTAGLIIIGLLARAGYGSSTRPLVDPAEALRRMQVPTATVIQNREPIRRHSLHANQGLRNQGKQNKQVVSRESSKDLTRQLSSLSDESKFN